MPTARAASLPTSTSAPSCRSCSGSRSGCSSAACSSSGAAPHWSSCPRARASLSRRRRCLPPPIADQELSRHPSLLNDRQKSHRPTECCLVESAALLTPLGHQEDWEDSPAGYPQTKSYESWGRHDEYEFAGPA